MTDERPAITVIGLGPGDPQYLTGEARNLLRNDHVYLRTRIHPTLDAMAESANWPTFDNLYEELDTFDEVYSHIVDTLIDIARREPVVYAVPGNPVFGEATVRLLLSRAADENVRVRVLPAVSFLDSVAAELQLDPIETNLQIVDALELVAVVDQQPFAGGAMPISPLRPAVVAQVYSPVIASGVKLALLQFYPETHEVTLVAATGMSGQSTTTLPLVKLDRAEVDHLNSLYVPAVDPLDEPRVAEGLQRIIARLRAPGGCPWDREQTHESLTRHMLEEAYEVIHAIEDGSSGDLAEELGDVLLQVYLHAQIAEEAGEFSLEDVFRAVSSKLVRRHPHVFGDRTIDTAGEVVKAWDEIKQEERATGESNEPASPFASIPRSLPALARAQSVIRRAKARGLDVEFVAAGHPGDERRAEIARQIAALVATAEDAGIDAEQTLRQWTIRFEQQAINSIAPTDR